jgi:hypothetical protein
MLERVGGACGLASAVVLLAYFLWNAFVVPPFTSGRAFLEFASARPAIAFADDWLLLTWLVLALGMLLGLHRRLSPLAADEAIQASSIGILGLLVAIMRSVFNIGRLQVLAAHYAEAAESERQTLVALLAWTEQGDAARNVALLLVGGWVLWSATLALRLRALPRAVAGLGLLAGLSVVPAFIGFLTGAAILTRPDGYLAFVFLLWMAWFAATGWALLRGLRD